MLVATSSGTSLEPRDDASGLSQHHLGCQVFDLVGRVVVLCQYPEVTHFALPRQPELVLDHEPPRRRFAAFGPRLNVFKAVRGPQIRCRVRVREQRNLRYRVGLPRLAHSGLPSDTFVRHRRCFAPRTRNNTFSQRGNVGMHFATGAGQTQTWMLSTRCPCPWRCCATFLASPSCTASFPANQTNGGNSHM